MNNNNNNNNKRTEKSFPTESELEKILESLKDPELEKILESLKELELKSLTEPEKNKSKQLEKALEKNQKAATLKEEIEKQEIEDRKSNRKLREKYADKMFLYMCIWSVIVIFILICNGFKCFSFQLDKWVLVTLIGSTTISVFAIVRAIIEGLFKNKA